MDEIKHRGGQSTEENYKGIPIHAARGVHQKVAELMAKLLKPGDKVADIGAGHGALSLRLHDAGYNVLPFDFNAEDWPVREMVCNICDVNESIQPVEGFGPFSAVCAIEIIEHLENPRRFLKELVAMAGKSDRETILIVSTPNPLDTFSAITLFTRGIFNWFSPSHYSGGGHISILPHWMISEHLKYLGVENQEWYFCAPYQHPNKLKQLVYKGISKIRRLVSRGGNTVAFHEGQTALVVARIPSRKINPV